MAIQKVQLFIALVTENTNSFKIWQRSKHRKSAWKKWSTFLHIFTNITFFTNKKLIICPGAEVTQDITASGNQGSSVTGMTQLTQTDAGRTAATIGNAYASAQTSAWAKALAKYTDILDAQSKKFPF